MIDHLVLYIMLYRRKVNVCLVSEDLMDIHRLHQTTSFADRFRFVWMWSGGMSARAISLETGASVTTICRWIRRWRKEGHVNTRPRKGRPQKNALSAKNIHSYNSSCQSDVSNAGVADSPNARNYAKLPAKAIHFLPFNSLSAMINFHYFQNVYTFSRQLPSPESCRKVHNSCKPLLFPELD